jgi:hypothetical protein
MVAEMAQEDTPWIECTATVTGCRRTFATSVDETTPRDDVYVLPEYEVTFEYQADGKIFTGKYRAGWPVEDGHSFAILYDPRNPKDNTGSESLHTAWNAFVRSVGQALRPLLGRLYRDR